MAILNYTTTIKVEKTVSEIQLKLAKVGAQAILYEYDDPGIICALSFRIMLKERLLSFKLSVNIEGVYQSLSKDPKVPKHLKTKEQASRVVWRITKNWIEAQLAFIEAGQATIEKLFLADLQNQSGQTLYQLLEDDSFRHLTGD